MNVRMVAEQESTRELYSGYEHRKGDSGLDLYFPEDVNIDAGKTQLVNLGVSCACSREGLPVSFWLLPRSSIYKTPLRMANGMGLIDSTYRGNLCVPLDNTGSLDYKIEKGTRLFQICSANLDTEISLEFVDSLSETDRGNSGFGSTGSCGLKPLPEPELENDEDGTVSLKELKDLLESDTKEAETEAGEDPELSEDEDLELSEGNEDPELSEEDDE